MRRFRRNPPLTVFANPPMKVGYKYEGKSRPTFRMQGAIGDTVHLIRYTHSKDGKDYEHVFESEDVAAFAVTVFGLRGVLLLGSQDIWDDYPDTMGDFD